MGLCNILELIEDSYHFFGFVLRPLGGPGSHTLNLVIPGSCVQCKVRTQCRSWIPHWLFWTLTINRLVLLIMQICNVIIRSTDLSLFTLGCERDRKVECETLAVVSGKLENMIALRRWGDHDPQAVGHCRGTSKGRIKPTKIIWTRACEGQAATLKGEQHRDLFHRAIHYRSYCPIVSCQPSITVTVNCNVM